MPWCQTHAQGERHPKPTPKPPTVTDGPTLSETKLWLETEGLPLLYAFSSHLDKQYLIGSSFLHRVSKITIDTCLLSFVTADTVIVNSQISKNTTTYEWTYGIPLRDLDLGALTVGDDRIEGLMDEAEQFVRIKTRAAVGPTIHTKAKDGTRSVQSEARLFVHNREDGERVAKAIARAGKFCGAAASPF